MRPADNCKPDCQRRVPVHPAPTASHRAFTRLDPIHRAVHAVAARFGSSHGPAAERCRLRGRSCDSPLALRRVRNASNELEARRPPRPHSPQSREGRRLQRPEAPSAGKANHESSRTAPRPLRAATSFLAPHHSRTSRVPSSTARQRSAATKRHCIDRSATCRFLQAARSTSTIPRTSEPRAPECLFSVEAFAPGGAASHRAPGRTGLAPRKRLPCGPAVPSSQHALTRLGQLEPAERPRVTARVSAGAGDADASPERPRLGSNRHARTRRLSTNRERRGRRVSVRKIPHQP